MLVGVYGLLLEGYNPGAVLPGVVGAIALLLALYAFQVLSVNYAGLALIVLGIALMIAEAFAPSFGVLGLGGVARIRDRLHHSDGHRGARLSDRAAAHWRHGARRRAGRPADGVVLRALAARAGRHGREQLLSEPAVALDDFDRSGPVRIRGEIWNAVHPLRQCRAASDCASCASTG